MRARLKIRPLLLRRHQRHDRGKVVRQRRSTDGKGGMRRHKANSAVGAREVQLSSTDPRSARCGGGMLAWNCMERVCGFQRTQNVPPSPKEVSSIACPTHWTRVHNASTSRKWCDGVKCALDGRVGWAWKKVRFTHEPTRCHLLVCRQRCVTRHSSPCPLLKTYTFLKCLRTCT